MPTPLTRRPACDRLGIAVMIMLLVVSVGADRAVAGDGVLVEGIVTYDGPVPDPVPIPEAASKRQLVEVNAETGGLKDAVVWVEGVPGSSLPDLPGPDGPIEMDQQNYEFIPHVLAIEDGQEVAFLNSDIANHGVSSRSSTQSNRFNVTTPPGGSHVQRFSTSRLPVAIGCPIHASMSAWVFVFDHPYHAVTDELGQFRLPPVPPGRYTLRVHHADGDLRLRRALTLDAAHPRSLRLPLEPSRPDRAPGTSPRR